jgi:hypothetical protein
VDLAVDQDAHRSSLVIDVPGRTRQPDQFSP